MFPYSIAFLLLFTQLSFTKPLNEGDMLFPDEMDLFAKIFSNNTNTVTDSDISVENKKMEEIEVVPGNVNINVTFGNRYLVNVPCQKGAMRIGRNCRITFEK